MSGNKMGKCPKCGYSAYKRKGQDKEGFFTYFKCRKGCGFVRVLPSGEVVNVEGLSIKSRFGTRSHICPSCGLPSIGKIAHRGTTSVYATITCDVCGKYSSYNHGPWRKVGENNDVAHKIRPRKRVMERSTSEISHLSDMKPAHRAQGEKRWVSDFINKAVEKREAKEGKKLGRPPKLKEEEEPLYNVYPNSVVRGNIDVRRRWEIEERLEAHRLAHEKDEWE